ncbi:unnamed protein product [Sphagnum jensenii]|uniref:ERCC1-like central domain-containing protein n=1 Tax=Sphagnum jensenii TaxID=128206 RepID=A0ABP1ACM4_9BRYO
MGMGSEEGALPKPLVHIPSYSQVLEDSRPQPPPSLFRASSQSSSVANPNLSSRSDSPAAAAVHVEASSFTEAFSFLRSTEFYSPPPPPPPAAPSPPAPASGPGSGPRSSWSNGNPLAANQQRVPMPVQSGQARNAIIVSRRQQGNPVLKHIRNVRWVFGDIVPDYLLGQTTCALYLSLRYHLLHPDYLYFRIRELQKSFRLRVVLCHIDVEDVIKPLHEVTKTALLHDCSLLCAWSLEECGRYLETIKMYENKPADNIQERTDNDYLSRLTGALTSVRHVNRTDVVTLGSTFGTLAAIMGASMEELARCPGIGERKVKRLYDAFHEPFRRTTKQLRLSSMGFTAGEGASNSPVSLSNPNSQQAGAVTAENPSGSNPASQQAEPEVSVRRALDAVYAKLDRRKVDGKDDIRSDGTKTDSLKAPVEGIEVIELD